jgi:exosortase
VNTPSVPASAVSVLAAPRRGWAVAGAALAVGLCAFGFIFRSEIATAVYVWSNSAYSHCFLVLPVAAYLAWDRRQAFTTIMPRPAPGIALLAIPVAAAWFVANRLGVMEGRQLMAMTLFQILSASLLGISAWRAFSAPFLYLFFLIPFGEFIVPPLQSFVVHFTGAGLDLLSIPNFLNGTTIEIPEGTFQVEAACAGLRFLVAIAAFGVPYVCLIYTNPLRRGLFIALSLVVAVVSNSFRVFGTILVAHFTDNVESVEAGHVYGGWVFYVVVLSAVMLIGLGFRQEQRSPTRVVDLNASGHTAAPSVVALALIIFLATMPRLAANYLDARGAGPAVAERIEAPAVPGCLTTPPPATPPIPTAAADPDPGVLHSIAYRCGDDLFVLTLRRYPPRIGVRPLFLSLEATQAPPGADIIRQSADIRVGNGPEAPVWRVTESQAGRYVAVATALWIDGRPAGEGIAARVNQALNTVRRSAVSPVIAVVTHSERDGPNDARRAIEGFLGKTTLLSEFVGKLLSAPPSVNGRR